jgi:hypothetical protein
MEFDWNNIDLYGPQPHDRAPLPQAPLTPAPVGMAGSGSATDSDTDDEMQDYADDELNVMVLATEAASRDDPLADFDPWGPLDLR